MNEIFKGITVTGDTTTDDINIKLSYAKEDVEKTAAALRSLSDELFELMPDNVIVQVAKPYYQIAVDYINKLRRELTVIQNDLQKGGEHNGK